MSSSRPRTRPGLSHSGSVLMITQYLLEPHPLASLTQVLAAATAGALRPDIRNASLSRGACPQLLVAPLVGGSMRRGAIQCSEARPVPEPGSTKWPAGVAGTPEESNGVVTVCTTASAAKNAPSHAKLPTTASVVVAGTASRRMSASSLEEPEGRSANDRRSQQARGRRLASTWGGTCPPSASPSRDATSTGEMAAAAAAVGEVAGAHSTSGSNRRASRKDQLPS